MSRMSCKLLIIFVMVMKSLSFSPICAPNSSHRLHTSIFSTTMIALTREEGNNAKLQKQLEDQLGDSIITIHELPCIAHADGDDLPQLASILTEQHWDYVAVTSPEAARVLASAWNFDSTSSHIPSVAVVGKATQTALEKLGIPVDFCPSKATAKTLVDELPFQIHDDVTSTSTTLPATTTTLLYPASAKAATTLQDGLTERGFSVTRLNTYDTTIAKWSEEEKDLSHSVSIVCFGSPSAVTGWLENTNDNRNVLAACIGETSANACRDMNFPVERIFYPEKPGIPGWVQAVQDAMASQVAAHHQ